MSADANVVTGGCFCGAIRYRAMRPPLGSMICHCESCRRAAGAPMVAWITFAAEEFAIVQGVPAVLDAMPPVERTFCGRCGTPLTYRHGERPGEIDVTTCSLDDPAAFPPGHHSWLEDTLPWVRLDDGLPTHPRNAG